jgi:N-acetylglucosaminyldiphosphoundecaprenol N-acetyl-beta-D-mannosaminyltransferase
MQRAGLEWFFRFAQEPLRLGPRYLKTNTRFALLLARELLAGRRRR